tara:strand:- start:1397 stop:1858 length:462 start_codon:yes stop_codon:yes gene_type:complete
MARRLIVMRHAKSSWKDPNLDDHDRSLNKRGRRDAPMVADAIFDRGWIPELILVSSSKRTLQTLEGMSHRLGKTPFQVRPGIYHATVSDLMEELEDALDNGTTMIIGHNPGSEILVNHLSGEWHTMPTATAVLLVQSGPSWTVADVIRPKQIV